MILDYNHLAGLFIMVISFQLYLSLPLLYFALLSMRDPVTN